MSQIIETQPVPAHIAHALVVLDSIRDDDPDLDACFRAGLAAATLRAVRPPYPPHPTSEPAVPAAAAIETADRALADAIEVAATAEEAVRCAAARAAIRGEPMESYPW